VRVCSVSWSPVGQEDHRRQRCHSNSFGRQSDRPISSFLVPTVVSYRRLPVALLTAISLSLSLSVHFSLSDPLSCYTLIKCCNASAVLHSHSVAVSHCQRVRRIQFFDFSAGSSGCVSPLHQRVQEELHSGIE
jgi:hypothetical protein